MLQWTPKGIIVQMLQIKWLTQGDPAYANRAS